MMSHKLGGVDLTHLTEEERDAILKVLERDDSLRDKEIDRVKTLRNEIKALKMKGVIKEGMDADKTCARCRRPFGWLFNKGALCPKCQHKICDNCKIVDGEKWMCNLCHKQMELEAMSGTWFYMKWRKSKRNKKTNKPILGGELVKSSFKRPHSHMNGTANQVNEEVKRALSNNNASPKSSRRSRSRNSDLGEGESSDTQSMEAHSPTRGRPKIDGAAFPGEADKALLLDLIGAKPLLRDRPKTPEQQTTVEIRRITSHRYASDSSSEGSRSGNSSPQLSTRTDSMFDRSESIRSSLRSTSAQSSDGRMTLVTDNNSVISDISTAPPSMAGGYMSTNKGRGLGVSPGARSRSRTPSPEPHISNGGRSSQFSDSAIGLGDSSHVRETSGYKVQAIRRRDSSSSSSSEDLDASFARNGQGRKSDGGMDSLGFAKVGAAGAGATAAVSSARNKSPSRTPDPSPNSAKRRTAHFSKDTEHVNREINDFGKKKIAAYHLPSKATLEKYNGMKRAPEPPGGVVPAQPRLSPNASGQEETSPHVEAPAWGVGRYGGAPATNSLSAPSSPPTIAHACTSLSAADPTDSFVVIYKEEKTSPRLVSDQEGESDTSSPPAGDMLHLPSMFVSKPSANQLDSNAVKSTENNEELGQDVDGSGDRVKGDKTEDETMFGLESVRNKVTALLSRYGITDDGALRSGDDEKNQVGHRDRCVDDKGENDTESFDELSMDHSFEWDEDVPKHPADDETHPDIDAKMMEDLKSIVAANEDQVRTQSAAEERLLKKYDRANREGDLLDDDEIPFDFDPDIAENVKHHSSRYARMLPIKDDEFSDSLSVITEQTEPDDPGLNDTEKDQMIDEAVKRGLMKSPVTSGTLTDEESHLMAQNMPQNSTQRESVAEEIMTLQLTPIVALPPDDQEQANKEQALREWVANNPTPEPIGSEDSNQSVDSDKDVKVKKKTQVKKVIVKEEVKEKVEPKKAIGVKATKIRNETKDVNRDINVQKSTKPDKQIAKNQMNTAGEESDDDGEFELDAMVAANKKYMSEEEYQEIMSSFTSSSMNESDSDDESKKKRKKLSKRIPASSAQTKQVPNQNQTSSNQVQVQKVKIEQVNTQRTEPKVEEQAIKIDFETKNTQQNKTKAIPSNQAVAAGLGLGHGAAKSDLSEPHRRRRSDGKAVDDTNIASISELTKMFDVPQKYGVPRVAEPPQYNPPDEEITVDKVYTQQAVQRLESNPDNLQSHDDNHESESDSDDCIVVGANSRRPLSSAASREADVSSSDEETEPSIEQGRMQLSVLAEPPQILIESPSEDTHADDEAHLDIVEKQLEEEIENDIDFMLLEASKRTAADDLNIDSEYKVARLEDSDTHVVPVVLVDDAGDRSQHEASENLRYSLTQDDDDLTSVSDVEELTKDSSLTMAEISDNKEPHDIPMEIPTDDMAVIVTSVAGQQELEAQDDYYKSMEEDQGMMDHMVEAVAADVHHSREEEVTPVGDLSSTTETEGGGGRTPQSARRENGASGGGRTTLLAMAAGGGDRTDSVRSRSSTNSSVPSISVTQPDRHDTASSRGDVASVRSSEAGSIPSSRKTNLLSPFSTSTESVVSFYSDAGEGNYGKVPVTGEIEFGLDFNYKNSQMEIRIKRCKDLAAVDTKKKRSDPYVKVYLLPDRTKTGKRKTRVKKHSLNPVFDETLKYALSKSELETRTLWIAVWHNDTFGRNDFLGEVTIPLDYYEFKDPAPRWHKLQERRPKPKNPTPLSLLTYKGDLNISLKYVTPENVSSTRKVKGRSGNKGELHILIKQARNLTAVRANGSSDPFCKGYLLPEKSSKGKQKTAVIKRNCNPEWNHTMVFEDVAWEELRERCMELTIWDHDRFTSNDFLGGIRMGLGTGKSYGKEVDWNDSKGEEISIWQSMLDRPNYWIQGTLLLRPNMDRRK